MLRSSFSIFAFYAFSILCLTPWLSSGVALLLGIVFALTFTHPFSLPLKNLTKRSLAYSIIALGAGMNLSSVISTGMNGFTYTLVGILSTFTIGIVLAKILKLDRTLSILISAGTAICGGSAIAAIAPAIEAESTAISVSLGVVFLLNSIALFLFPYIGHHFLLSETQFGLWSALAIHDTSSVVGATLQYGPEALRVGTTVKLSRALWIVVITPVIGWIHQKHRATFTQAPPARPWFILGFLLMAAIFTYSPSFHPYGVWVEYLGKRGLTLTLFWIGSALSLTTLKTVGAKPLMFGFALWAMIASASLFFILHLT